MKFGRVLRIDLARQEIKTGQLEQEIIHDFIGGRGLGAKLIWNEIGPDVEPFSPNNKLILTVGPFTGTPFPTASRVVMLAKSPLTNSYMYSMAGGVLGTQLRRAGYDVVIIEGKAQSPVYLVITGEGVKFRDASHLWGMRTSLALYHLKSEAGQKSAAAIIGPAGENLVRYAGVMTDDWRQFGRGGLGAVMGSKNVKAIIVQGNQQRIEVEAPSEYDHWLKEIVAALRKKPGTCDSFSRYGSGESQEARSVLGCLPTRNWSQSTFAEARKISMNYMRDNLGLVVKDTGCYGCPVRCGKLTLVRKGQFSGASTDGPEYETFYALGSNCLIGDPEAVIAANSLCDELGLDTMSAGVSISFVMECFEKGLLTAADTGGKEIRFGDGPGLIALLEDIAYRRGLGDFVAEGTKRMAAQIGGSSESFAMHVKGLELGGYEPRSAKGQAIVFAAGNRGGCHHSIGLPVFEEQRNNIQFETKGKGQLVKKHAAARILQDSVVNCSFAYSRTLDWELWANALNAVLGTSYNVADLQTAAARINTLERCYNLREGFTAADDTLPRRLMEEPLPDGPGKGERVSPADLRELLSQYYAAMEWNAETGVPCQETLVKLNLSWVSLKG